MMKYEYRSIPIHLVDVPDDRLRQANPDRVETLSKDITANGQLQPIGVTENDDGGRFTLTFGLHRLLALRALKHDEIDARVTLAVAIKPQEARLQEIMENLDREGLTALQRMETFAELKRVHEEMYPQAKHGGDRKSATARKRKNQEEIFSFRSEAAERVGLSVRMINDDIAILSGLSEGARQRVRGSWIADHRASLKALSAQEPDMQSKVLDVLLATPPEAANVADAIVLTKGERLKTTAEKLYAATDSNWSRLSDSLRAAFLDQHEAQVRAHAKKRGWL